MKSGFIRKIFTKKVFAWLGVVALLALLATEIIGRRRGLANLSLYRADDHYEYIANPNQDVIVYGNRFITNSFSMRSDEPASDDSCTVLVIGDSIIYGGNSIDQDSLGTVLLQKLLRAKFKKKITILNISSQSWGPDNAAQYIKKHGLFGAKQIIMVYSTHDAHDNIDYLTEVGAPPYYKENHLFATHTVIDKIVRAIQERFRKHDVNGDLGDDAGRQRFFPKNGPPNPINPKKNFNTGFAFFDSLSKADHIPLTLYLHAETTEITDGKYARGGQEILEFCRVHGIPVIQGIESEKTEMYDDYLHFNSAGQKLMAEKIFEAKKNSF